MALILTGVKTTRPLFKKGSFTDGPDRFRAVPNGTEHLTYALEVDYNDLHSMAKVAAKNKSGKSVRGPFTVIITSRFKSEPLVGGAQ